MDELRRLPLSQLDVQECLFEISFEPCLDTLKQSIDRQGIITPIRVHADRNRCVLISGFRRVACAKGLGIQEVPAIILKNRDPLKLFYSAIEENIHTRQFNLIEKALILHKLEKEFYVSREHILSHAMPLIGMDSSEKHLRLYNKLLAYSRPLQSYIVRQKLPVHVIEEFSRFNTEELNLLLPILNEFKWSVASLKEMLIWSHEIILRERIDLKTLLDSSVREDLNSFRHFIKKRRYPRLQELEQTFGDLKKKVNLPLDAPRFFEENKYQLKVSFSNKDEFQNLVNRMHKAADQRELDEILKLL